MCLTWYFTGKAPAGLGDLFRATAVTQCLVVVPVIPLVPALLRAALNHFLHGEVSDWFCSPISNSVGLQIHLITDPISPNWSANFLIYSYKLYIFSSVKEETQSLLGIYFLSSLSSALSDWVPRCHTFLPKRHSYVATVKKKRNSCASALWKKQNENQMYSTNCCLTVPDLHFSDSLDQFFSFLFLYPCDVAWQLTTQLFLQVWWKPVG